MYGFVSDRRKRVEGARKLGRRSRRIGRAKGLGEAAREAAREALQKAADVTVTLIRRIEEGLPQPREGTGSGRCLRI
jgi:hypothetical protein